MTGTAGAGVGGRIGRIGRVRRRAGGLGAALMATVLAGLALAPGSHAEDPEFLIFGAGAFDLNGDDTAAMISLEYVDDRKWLWALKPMTGIFANLDGGFYAYAGLALDLHFGRRFVLTPSFAPGLYFEGGSKDLGHVIEFRSSIKAAWRFDDRSRLGVDFSHISNAGLDERNPGANQLMLFYSMPLSRKGP